MGVYVHGVGVAAPGMGDWLAARSVLSGQSHYAPSDVSPGSPAFLPPNERRRVSRTIKLALQVAHEAVQTAAVPLPQIPPVFASAWGDLEIMDRIHTALTQPERPVSPTHFHNSVHNAAAGYWSIGTGTLRAVNAVAANELSFTAGLLEAATLAASDGGTALLVAYDVTPPAALRSAVAVTQTFATALLLGA
ncbi:MAG TPA: beta-ketoacyl synthase chain length factor, partial [bacterium]